VPPEWRVASVVFNPIAMMTRTVVPLSAVVLVLAAAGCQHSAGAAGTPGAMAQAPAPFASPPVLPGTPDVATLVAKVKPAVVNITTVHEVRVRPGGPEMPDLGDLMPFFQHGPHGSMRPVPRGGPEGDETMKSQALGSGFLVDAQGHVVTNAHVIDGATTVKVRLADDRELRAKVVGKDDRLDVALLQLENAPKDLPLVSLGSSDALRVGEYVVAIGNPFGLGNTVTMGIVSAKGRTIGAGPYDDFIQTDASINPGNSGGPLFDLHGQVVGINTAINPNGKGIGFAIPIDAVKAVLPQLAATGHVARGQLGVVVQGMDEDLAKALGLDRSHGALVEEVEPDSPARASGVAAGDVIVAVDGQDVGHSEDLPRMIASHAPGSHVKLSVVRDKQKREIDVTLAKLEDKTASNDAAGGDDSQADPETAQRSNAIGVRVAEQDGHVVVERVAPDGPADGKLRPGDVIDEVNRAHVSSASDLAAKLKDAPADEPVLLHVRHGGQARFVAIERR
jgi:serine protease Do